MSNSSKTYHATTVLCMLHNVKTIMMADGQVTFGDMAV